MDAIQLRLDGTTPTTLDERIAYGHDILARALAEHKPGAVAALFSGGHDSLCAVDLAMRYFAAHDVPAFVVHINTGIGVEETRDFVRDVCRTRGWELREYRPPVPYEQIVEQHGFPGPAQHGTMYIRLKERCIRQLHRDVRRKRGDRLLLVTGVRRYESVRRMGHVREIQRDGGRVWAAPIIEFTPRDKNDYMRRYDLPRNPVVDVLHMSGECLCGAYAQPEMELELLRIFYPAAYAQIMAVRQRAIAAGVHAEWGTPPPAEEPVAPGQTMMCFKCVADSVNAAAAQGFGE